MEHSPNHTELRLFLEELCCQLCRFRRMEDAGIAPERILIEREVPVGRAGAFGDILVTEPGEPSYLIEIKYGLPVTEMLERLRFKYGAPSSVSHRASRLLVVVDGPCGESSGELRARIQDAVVANLQVELWGEAELLAQIARYLHLRIDAIDEHGLRAVRDAVQRIKGYHAFGGESLADYRNDALREELLWRLGFWRLRQLREARNLQPHDILPPGLYRGVAVVIADLCSFSSYVRDTPDDQVVRQSLTSFYSKARFEVVNRGGMLETFVGDQVLALFGVPERAPGYIEQALDTAKSMLWIGEAISADWQRRIDRVQPSSGMHVGVAYGDLQIVPLRPSSRTHMTAIADVINVSARLMTSAGPGEIVVTNTFYLKLPQAARQGFTELEPQDGRNVGRIKSWRYRQPRLT